MFEIYLYTLSRKIAVTLFHKKQTFQHILIGLWKYKFLQGLDQVELYGFVGAR